MSNNPNNWRRSMKIANLDRVSFHYLLSDWNNFKEIFKKDVTYDNIKSHKK